MLPQFTLEHAANLLSNWITQNPETVEAKKAAMGFYSKYFAPDNLDDVTMDGFKDFLLLKNNQHWDKLYRHPEIYADMDRLRECLKRLLNEAVPIESRLDTIIPKHGPGLIKGLSRTVVTAI